MRSGKKPGKDFSSGCVGALGVSWLDFYIAKYY